MEEGDLVLCKVEKVTNTIIFVSLPNKHEGTIVSSEIASGRIKLMRQYVVPNKQIVCKILRVDGNHIQLSLRRVSSKEKKEVMSKFKQVQAIKTAFKQILKENAEKTESKILEDFDSIEDFANKAREDESLITKYVPKENIDGIKNILEKKKKSTILKQTIKIKCIKDDGVKRIKEIFKFENEDITVKYISAGNFTIELTVDDFKTGKHQMQEILEELTKKAQENECEFNIN